MRPFKDHRLKVLRLVTPGLRWPRLHSKHTFRHCCLHPCLQVRLYDGELEAARWCALEEASLDGSRLLAYLPGSILVNKEPLGTAFQSDVCPNRVTRSVLTAVYDLLQVRQFTYLGGFVPAEVSLNRRAARACAVQIFCLQETCVCGCRTDSRMRVTLQGTHFLQIMGQCCFVVPAPLMATLSL